MAKLVWHNGITTFICTISWKLKKDHVDTMAKSEKTWLPCTVFYFPYSKKMHAKSWNSFWFLRHNNILVKTKLNQSKRHLYFKFCGILFSLSRFWCKQIKTQYTQHIMVAMFFWTLTFFFVFTHSIIKTAACTSRFDFVYFFS